MAEVDPGDGQVAPAAGDRLFGELSVRDRQLLVQSMRDNETWLMAQVLSHAQALGYTRYTSTLLEAWRMSVVGLTESVARSVEVTAVVPELSPELDARADLTAAFGIAEARAHRSRGVNLSMFLGLFKYYRLAYLTLLGDPELSGVRFDDAALVVRFVDRVFDRIELGYTTEWSGTSAEQQIRDLSAANLAATNEKTRLLTLIESLPLPALVVNNDHTVELMNRLAAEVLDGSTFGPGQAYYGVEGSSLRASPAWLDDLVDRLVRRAAAGPGVALDAPLEVELVDAAGRTRTFLAYGDQMLDISHKFAGHVVAMMDVTQSRADALALEQGAAVFTNSTNAIVVTDPTGVIVTVNPAFTTVFGWSSEQAIGSRAEKLLGFPAEIWLGAPAGPAESDIEDGWHGEARLSAVHGRAVEGWLTLTNVRDPDGELREVIGVFADVSPLIASEDRFEHLSKHDPLTGLLNRTGLREELDAVLARNWGRGGSVAVVFLDLDRFKEINDTKGHGVGDEVLRQAADRLRTVLRDEDILARLGGDEFLAVARGIRHERHAVLLAEKIRDCLADPMMINGLTFQTSGSIGVALSPRDGTDADTLVRNADAAMYLAKRSGRDQVAFYRPKLTEVASARLTMANELRAAVRQGTGLSVVYQPIIELANGNPVGVEALLRWDHDALGSVSPKVFVPLAEEIGLIPALGHLVLEQAVDQLRAWRADGVPVGFASVNVSPIQLERATYVADVVGVLTNSGLARGSVRLEVTEGTLFQVKSRGAKVLSQLKELGIRVALDDFGTGYSSLSRLAALPIDVLKIDQAFITGLSGDDPDPRRRRATVEAIIALAHASGLSVTAEGIEDVADAQVLIDSNCENGQGFLYARPTSPAGIPAAWNRLLKERYDLEPSQI